MGRARPKNRVDKSLLPMKARARPLPASTTPCAISADLASPAGLSLAVHSWIRCSRARNRFRATSAVTALPARLVSTMRGAAGPGIRSRSTAAVSYIAPLTAPTVISRPLLRAAEIAGDSPSAAGMHARPWPAAATTTAAASLGRSAELPLDKTPVPTSAIPATPRTARTASPAAMPWCTAARGISDGPNACSAASVSSAAAGEPAIGFHDATVWNAARRTGPGESGPLPVTTHPNLHTSRCSSAPPGPNADFRTGTAGAESRANAQRPVTLGRPPAAT